MSTSISAPSDSVELKGRIQRFQDTQAAITREVGKVIVGQQEVIEHVLISLFVGRPYANHRIARHGQDIAGPDAGRDVSGCSSSASSSRRI